MSEKYYRFNCGMFIQAPTFERAKEIFIERLNKETENKKNWHACTCLGFSHRHDCPEGNKIIPS